ncbi:MAG: hypothetical protein LPK21_09815 [Hymenobacteraceae bacterium]|nr:hypothetical protein [Hymenobacteraceae bacterium]
MRKFLSIATVVTQIGFTFALLFVMYMIFAMFDYKGGFANFVGLTMFQPLIGFVLSGLTILVCFILGLPIRLNKSINHWWRRNFYFSVILLVLGITLCIISLTPGFIEEVTYRMEGIDFKDTVPNQLLSVSGWFSLAFGALHVYLPYNLQQKIEKTFLTELKL